MFQWLNKQGVVSDAGYILQRMHRFYYHYVEGDNILQVNVEPGSNCEEIFFSEHPQWNIAHNPIPIDQEKLECIKKNIHDALSFMGVAHRFN